MVEVAASYQITERTKERDTVYIALPRIQERWTYLLVKRLFDSFSALIGLIVLAIPMAIIALLIVLDSPGGAIFKQERLGKNGKPFLIYKFRFCVCAFRRKTRSNRNSRMLRRLGAPYFPMKPIVA